MKEITDYGKSYFDPERNLGYSDYVRTSEFEILAKQLFDRFDLLHKSVLDVGCAKGFLVKSLRDLHVDALGVDVSSYAIKQGEKLENNQFLLIGDAREDLNSFEDGEFDLVVGIDFLDCFSEQSLKKIIPEINRISKKQFHKISSIGNEKWYQIQKLQWWKKQGLKKGTIIFDCSTNKEVIVKWLNIGF